MLEQPGAGGLPDGGPYDERAQLILGERTLVVVATAEVFRATKRDLPPLIFDLERSSHRERSGGGRGVLGEDAG